MKLSTVTRSAVVTFFLILLLGTGLKAQDQNIGGDLTGEPLLEYLRDNYTPNSTLGYNTARDRMYTILDNFDGVVVCVYTYFEVAVDPNSSSPRQDALDNNRGINAEHLWPQSLGAGNEPMRSDLHSLYPSEMRVNQDRGNLRFGSIPDNQVDLWYNKVNRDETNDIFSSTPPPEEERHLWSKRKNGDRFESKLDRQGDIARAMFYFYTIYRAQADAEDPNYFSSMDDALREWHNADEVDSYELTRTQTIAEWQGNVNPFVMDTTLIRRAYFSEDGGEGPGPEPGDDEVVFYESFGNPSSTTSIEAYTYDNTELTFTGNGDIRSSIPSAGYEGASGNGLVFMNDGDRFLTISEINTTGFEDIMLSFGVHAGNSDVFTIEYSIDDGSNWTNINHGLTQPTNSWTLLEIEETGIPAHESVAIRFSKDNAQQYRLDDITLSGFPEVGTSINPNGEMAEGFMLEQNYPNPFNPSTSIQFTIPEQQHVSVRVYNMLGREVATLTEGVRPAGNHTVSWDASSMSSGIYIYRLETQSFQMMKKMTLIK